MKFDYGGNKAKSVGVYSVGNLGKIKCVDIFNFFWDKWKLADVVFIDFPYDNRMVKHYYEQIDVETDKTFQQLMSRAFHVLDAISPKRLFIEIGKRNADAVESAAQDIGYKTKRHPCFYMKRNPCYIIECCRHEDSFVNYQIADIDELDSIDNICYNESKNGYTICDFFNGQGAVSRTAYKHGMKFVCSELNPNRIGKALKDLSKMGADIQWEE